MIFILNKQQEYVGVAVNGSPNSLPYTQDIHYETLEGVHTYEFFIPANHEQSGIVEVEGFVIITDMDGNRLLFKIKEVMDNYEDNVPVRRLQCESAAISELLGDVQRPMTLLSSSLENTAITILNSSTGWTLGTLEAEIGTEDFKITDYMTVLEALTQMAKEYDVEVYYTVDFVNNEIVNKHVNIVTLRGNDTGLRFDYGHHLRNVSRTENSENVITAIIPIGKGNDSAERLTVTTLASFDDGDFYHTLGTDWIGSDSALQNWGRNGVHIFGYKVFDTADTITSLKTLGISELQYRSQPSLAYSTTIIDVERITGYDARKIRLGDTVIINDSTFDPPILIEGRVQEIRRSYTNSYEFNDDIKLGNYITLEDRVPTEVIKLQNAISLNEEKWNKITCSIESTGGDAFKNGLGTTILTARVFKGGQEVDLNGTDYTYTWYKYDKDGVYVSTWTKTGKSITITDTDVLEKATFKVDID
jgi:phage minor structural protein